MRDIMYLQQVLRQPDARKFVKAVIKGDQWSHQQQPLEAHPTYRGTLRHWDCALSMGNATQARSHGGKCHKAQGQAQPSWWEAGIWHKLLWNLPWFAIWLLIVFGILFCWSLHQVDFVMAYPQAPIEMGIYIELPTGIHTKHGNSKDQVFKLLANI